MQQMFPIEELTVKLSRVVFPDLYLCVYSHKSCVYIAYFKTILTCVSFVFFPTSLSALVFLFFCYLNCSSAS